MKEIIKKVFSFIKSLFNNDFKTNIGVRIDIWTHFMRGCIIDYVH